MDAQLQERIAGWLAIIIAAVLFTAFLFMCLLSYSAPFRTYLSYEFDDGTIECDYRAEPPAEALLVGRVEYNLLGTICAFQVYRTGDFARHATPLLDKAVSQIRAWKYIWGTKEVIAGMVWDNKELMEFLYEQGWRRHKNGKMFYAL